MKEKPKKREDEVYHLYELVSKVVVTADAEPSLVRDIDSWNLSPDLMIVRKRKSESRNS